MTTAGEGSRERFTGAAYLSCARRAARTMTARRKHDALTPVQAHDALPPVVLPPRRRAARLLCQTIRLVLLLLLLLLLVVVFLVHTVLCPARLHHTTSAVNLSHPSAAEKKDPQKRTREKERVGSVCPPQSSRCGGLLIG